MMDSVVKPVQWCPLCEKIGSKRRLKLFQINLEEAVWICDNDKCPYPLGTGSVSGVIVQRKSSEIGNKRKRKTRPDGRDGNVRKMSRSETSSVSDVSSVITCTELDDLLDFLSTSDQPTEMVPSLSLSQSTETIPSVSLNQTAAVEPTTSVLVGSQERIPISTPGDDVRNIDTKGFAPTRNVIHDRQRMNVDSNRTANCNNSISTPDTLSQKPCLDKTRDKKPFKRKVFGGYTPGEKTNINAFQGSTGSRENCHINTAKDCTDVGDIQEGTKEGNICLQWQNQNAMCWLDVVLCTLVHCKSVHTLLDGLNGNGTSLIKELCQKYDEAMQSVFDVQKTTNMTSSHHHGNSDQATQTLNDIRQKIWSHLQPGMKCELGRDDSPVLALPLLIKENTGIQEQFLLKYHWKFVCTDCGYQQTTRHEKVLITFPNVPPDFDISHPSFVRPCYRCKATNQRSTMIIDRTPDCVMMHFVEGLPTNDFDSYKFVSKDATTYAVSAVIQYLDSPRHFIAWCKHPHKDLWLKCDDLESAVCCWSNEIPNIPSSEIHVVMWERQSKDTNKTYSQTQIIGTESHDISTGVSHLLVAGTNGIKSQETTTKQRCSTPAAKVFTPTLSSERQVHSLSQTNKVKGESNVRGQQRTDISTSRLISTANNAQSMTTNKKPAKPARNKTRSYSMMSTSTPRSDSANMNSILNKIPIKLFGSAGTHGMRKPLELPRKQLKPPPNAVGQRSTSGTSVGGNPVIGQQGTNSIAGHRSKSISLIGGNHGSRPLSRQPGTNSVAVQSVGKQPHSTKFSSRKSFTGYFSAADRQNSNSSGLPKPIMNGVNKTTMQVSGPWQPLSQSNTDTSQSSVKKWTSSISYSDQSSPSSVSSGGSMSSRDDLFSSVHDELCKALDINEYDSGISSQVPSPIDEDFFSSLISENRNESTKLMNEVMDELCMLPVDDII
ncbi:uncharacterized protein LOC144444475 [Glandiceps talaboti]